MVWEKDERGRELIPSVSPNYFLDPARQHPKSRILNRKRTLKPTPLNFIYPSRVSLACDSANELFLRGFMVEAVPIKDTRTYFYVGSL